MSSVLESFYIQVKLETDQLKKGIADTQAQVSKLEQGFDRLSHSGDNVAHSMQNVLTKVTSMVAGFVSFNALVSGARGAIDSVRGVGQAAREMNVDVSRLDAWGNAVARMGGSAEGFRSSLQELAEHFGTSSNIAMQALPRLADSFARLNPNQAMRYGKSLGLDTSTIMLLQQGRREVEEVIKQQMRLGVVNVRQAESVRKFDMALYDAKHSFQEFYREITLPIIPYFTKALDWTVENKDLVHDAFKFMGAGVGLLSLALLRLNPIATAAVAGLTAFSAAYAIAKDDLAAYERGDKSVLGTVEEAPMKIGARIMKFFGYGNNPDDILGNALINGLSQANLATNYGNKNTPTTITVGDININTAATDAAGIAEHAFSEVKRQAGLLISQSDNGVAK